MSAVEAHSPPLAAIFGLSGETLTEDEKHFFRNANPLGFILFARNCKSPVQLKALTSSLQDLLGRALPILIDQEGGRVQRLRPPHWGSWPAARQFGDQPLPEGTRALAESFGDLSAELAAHGININCAPVLDVAGAETDISIGDRAFSGDPDTVALLGATLCRASLARGVLPVVKHLPGLGRAALDTHKDLPVIEADTAELERDFFPFAAVLREPFAPAVWGMVGHAVYRAIDPDTPASCSPAVIGGAIRRRIGFEGLLLTDDLDMGALAIYGSAGARAERALAAGCDIALQCNGDLRTMEEAASRIPLMTEAAITRYNRSVQWLQQQIPNA